MLLKKPFSKQPHARKTRYGSLKTPDYIPKGKFFNVNGLRTHVVIRGEGEPIILVHGLASYVYAWRHNLDELAKSHRVYALDLPGFGLSEKPDHRDYSLGAQADFIEALMNVMGIDCATLVGNSMGGGIALEFALRHPDRLNGLIIMGSVGVREDHFPRWIRGVTSRIVRGGPATSLMIPGRRRLRWIMNYLYHDPSKILPEDIDAFLFPLRTREFKRALCSMIQTLYLKLSDVERLSEIEHPALILWGEEDRILSIKLAEKFREALPNSQLVIVPEAGHALNQEQPDIVNRHIINFLLQINN